MNRVGSVDIPQEAFSAVLQLNAPTIRERATCRVRVVSALVL